MPLLSHTPLTLTPLLVLLRFMDGEVFVKINQEIRGRDCFVIIPTNSNDR